MNFNYFYSLFYLFKLSINYILKNINDFNFLYYFMCSIGNFFKFLFSKKNFLINETGDLHQKFASKHKIPLTGGILIF